MELIFIFVSILNVNNFLCKDLFLMFTLTFVFVDIFTLLFHFFCRKATIWCVHLVHGLGHTLWIPAIPE